MAKTKFRLVIYSPSIKSNGGRMNWNVDGEQQAINSLNKWRIKLQIINAAYLQFINDKRVTGSKRIA